MFDRDFSKDGYIALASYECCCLSSYLDSGGVKTVGIGSTSSDIPDLANWSWDKTLTLAQIVQIYKNGLKKYIFAVQSAIHVTQKPYQFDALVSLCYNIGVSGFSNSSAVRAINSIRPEAEVLRTIKMWNKDNGKVVKGLINRRQAECDLYSKGVYRTAIALIEVNAKHKPIYTSKTVDIHPFL